VCVCLCVWFYWGTLARAATDIPAWVKVTTRAHIHALTHPDKEDADDKVLRSEA
jgi:hypothetical protein